MISENSDDTLPFMSFAPRTQEIIGRNNQVQLIKQVIMDLLNAYIVYIVGVGGIGKTRLLEEIAVIRQQWQEEPFLWSNIIDLYHPEYHTPLGVQAAVIQALDPGQQYFLNYRYHRREFEEKQNQEAAWSGEELEKMRSALDQLFLDEYTALAAQQRIVLSFDTVELLQYEVGAVQRICDVPNVEMVIKNWLQLNIPKLPNTVTLFAGRPQPAMKDEFEQVFNKPGSHYIFIELDVLSQEDTQEYLAALGQVNPKLVTELEPLMVEKIIKLARGRAIYLTLLVDLFLNGGLEINVLYEESGQGTADDKQMDDLLARHLRTLPRQLGLMVDYLAHARKGLDEELLRYLSGWSDEEIKVVFSQMRQLTIVKTHQRTDQLFFHDHVYDLYDRYYLTASPRNTALYTQIAAYYDDKMDEASKIAKLYYELQKDAEQGYHGYYARWDEEAIKNHKNDFDMRLRNEVLHFFNRYVFHPASEFYDERIASKIDQAVIHRDCAIRWIKRHLARGKNEDALRIAERIYNSPDALFNWKTDKEPLYRAGLLAAWGEAMLYLNEPREKVRHTLTEAIRWLGDFEPQNDNQKWQRNRILGRVHNNLGYHYWAHGRYHDALEQFRLALPKFREVTIEDEQADTLNNLGFLMALLGRPSLGLNHIIQALRIREKLGYDIPIAFSHMTRSYVVVLEGHPIGGERHASKALDIFTRYNYQRGIGMVNNGLGFAARKRGNQWKEDIYSPQEAQGYFQEAIAYFEKAATTFAGKVREPLRKWEAYNELGSTFCDWGWLILNHPELGDEAQVLAKYQDSIKYQEMALAIAEQSDLSFQLVDSYDDLAQVYGDMSFLLNRMGRRDEAERYQRQGVTSLSKIEQLIPDEYLLHKGKGFSDRLTEGNAYWLALGKLYYWRGIWSFRQIEYQLVPPEQLEAKKREAAKQLITSCVYYYLFWPTSEGLERATDRLCRNLQHIKASPTWAHKQVRQMAKMYPVDLSSVHRAIDDILGIEA